MMWKGIIEQYRAYLPVTASTPIVTLCEGNTPLIYANHLSEETGADIFLKFEGMNPTGSFKDRGMTMALTKAKEDGSKVVICASTGNTSASAAAYAARAGIRCVVLVPNGAIALGKLSQALVHNAQVIALDGNFDDALRMVKEISQNYPITLVNSLNPFRIEGQKTGSFEICDQLGFAPDIHSIPVGNAGNITAYWKGYSEYQQNGKITSKPIMVGFQAEGAAPIVKNKIIDNPKTFATAIKIGNPASWKTAVEAREQSGGLIDEVSEDEILQSYLYLAKKEGVFCEPASAASVAGIKKLAKRGYFSEFKNKHSKKPVVVSILTGHGLKDPDSALLNAPKPKVVPVSIESILQEINLKS